jgi:hypothetical protein
MESFDRPASFREVMAYVEVRYAWNDPGGVYAEVRSVTHSGLHSLRGSTEGATPTVGLWGIPYFLW